MILYKEPTQLNKFNFWLALITLLLWTYLMSFVYSMLVSVCPFVYINFLITLGYAISIGIGAIILGKLFKITQKKNTITMAISASLFGIYFSWIAMIYYFIPGIIAADEYFLSPKLLYSPLTVFEIIIDINKVGLWSLFGVPFYGLSLTFVWMLEVFIVVFVSYKLNKNIAIQPFDIISNKWYKKYILYKEFETFSYLPEFAEKIYGNPLEELTALGNGSAYSFGEVSIFHLNESETCYLSLHNIGRNRDGKSVKSKEVLLLLEISKSDADQLMEKFKFKRKWFLDF